MGYAKIYISNDLLAKVLHMPDGVKFYNGQGAPKDYICLVVEHDDLPGDIDNIPLIRPIHKQIQFDWNLQKDD